MGINITQTMGSFQFENRENLRNAAKNILSKQGASPEAAQKIVEKTIFDTDLRTNYNSQLAVIKASSQINISDSLKETLKYLKSHAARKAAKEPVLGELWNLLNSEDSVKEYAGDLVDFVIDESAENIFAAA